MKRRTFSQSQCIAFTYSVQSTVFITSMYNSTSQSVSQSIVTVKQSVEDVTRNYSRSQISVKLTINHRSSKIRHSYSFPTSVGGPSNPKRRAKVYDRHQSLTIRRSEYKKSFAKTKL